MHRIQPITTRDHSSGRFHERYVMLERGRFDRDNPFKNARRILTDERCNLDDAGKYDYMFRGTRADRGDGIPIGTDAALLCQYCFPVSTDD